MGPRCVGNLHGMANGSFLAPENDNGITTRQDVVDPIITRRRRFNWWFAAAGPHGSDVNAASSHKIRCVCDGD